MDLSLSLEEKIVSYLDNYRNNEEVLSCYVRKSAKLINTLLGNCEININVTNKVDVIDSHYGNHLFYLNEKKENSNLKFKCFELFFDERFKEVYFDYVLCVGEERFLLEDKALFEVLIDNEKSINWKKILFHFVFIKCVFEKTNKQLTSQFIFDSIKCFYSVDLQLKDIK